MVTITDIAKEVGVSPSTVSNVLNNKKNVGPLVKQKVLDACEKMGYEYKNNNYQSVLDEDLIIFEYSMFKRDFYSKILSGIYTNSVENDFKMIVVPKEARELFMSPRISKGAIILDETVTNQEVLDLANEGYPIVLMDRIIESNNVVNVVTSNYPIMSKFIKELVNKGYKKFGYLKGNEDSFDNKERFNAYKDALIDSNLLIQNQLIYSGDYSDASGYQVGKILSISNNLPDVLVCANDEMAIGVIRALKEKGIRVPEDIGVTGFDDIDEARVSDLTTLSIPRYESGFLASTMLLQMINKEIKTPQTLFIEPEIVWRGTTK